jgi:3-methyladenine DNA glycosylase Mpg
MSNISTTCRSDCRRLVRSFFDQDCHTLCVAVLRKVLARKLPMTGEIVRGRIVETEAYPRGKSKEYAVERKEFSSHELANGPSKLCMVFDITRDDCDKLDMTESDSELWLEESNGDDESGFRNGGF